MHASCSTSGNSLDQSNFQRVSLGNVLTAFIAFAINTNNSWCVAFVVAVCEWTLQEGAEALAEVLKVNDVLIEAREN